MSVVMHGRREGQHKSGGSLQFLFLILFEQKDKSILLYLLCLLLVLWHHILYYSSNGVIIKRYFQKDKLKKWSF